MAEELPFRKEIDFAYGVPSELAPGIRRIVANNPSPFTYKGTNTYLLGRGPTLALIDPGPTDDVHFDAILKTAGAAQITHVLITHTHRDHTDGLERLIAATGAKTCDSAVSLSSLASNAPVRRVARTSTGIFIRISC